MGARSLPSVMRQNMICERHRNWGELAALLSCFAGASVSAGRAARVLVCAAIVATAGVCGCSDTDVLTPLQTHAVCMSDEDGKPSCDAKQLLAEVDSWLGMALHRPKSSFSVWLTGQGADRVHPVIGVCVPETWGAGVMQAKREFVERARALSERGFTSGERIECMPSVGGGMEVLRLLGEDSATVNRRKSVEYTKAGAQSPLHEAIVCDLSDSGLEATCSAATISLAIDRWMDRSELQAGSSLAVYGVGTSRDTTLSLFTITIPDRALGERYVRAWDGRSAILRGLPPNPQPDASAIVEAVHVASVWLDERIGRRSLTLLSDLRQYTRRQWNFENSVPDQEQYHKWLRDKGLFADLKGADVFACGLHHGRAPGASPFEADLVQRLSALWRATFVAMNAGDVRLRVACDDELAVVTAGGATL